MINPFDPQNRLPLPQLPDFFNALNAQVGSNPIDSFAGAIGNVEDFLIQTLGDSADFARQRLLDVKAQLDANNAVRKALRDAISHLGNGQLETILKDAGLDSIWNDIKDKSNDDQRKALEGHLETQGDINSKLGFTIQVTANLVSQAETLMSTVRKKFDDAGSAIIRNV